MISFDKIVIIATHVVPDIEYIAKDEIMLKKGVIRVYDNLFTGVLLAVLSMLWCTFTRSFTRKKGTQQRAFFRGAKLHIRDSKQRKENSPGDCFQR